VNTAQERNQTVPALLYSGKLSLKSKQKLQKDAGKHKEITKKEEGDRLKKRKRKIQNKINEFSWNGRP
jgi:membrane protein insertase Oxa1/YidC/SpoIIIJ